MSWSENKHEHSTLSSNWNPYPDSPEVSYELRVSIWPFIVYDPVTALCFESEWHPGSVILTSIYQSSACSMFTACYSFLTGAFFHSQLQGEKLWPLPLLLGLEPYSGNKTCTCRSIINAQIWGSQVSSFPDNFGMSRGRVYVGHTTAASDCSLLEKQICDFSVLKYSWV